MQGNSTDLFGDAPGKICKGCKKSKPFDDFYLIRSTQNGKLYRYPYCKACGRKNRAAWHFTANGQKAHRKHGLRNYGMTPAEYDAMFVIQNGLCVICQQPERYRRPGTKQLRQLCVDHDHATGKIRGLLCAACNKAIGLFSDDPKLLYAAIDYLKKST